MPLAARRSTEAICRRLRITSIGTVAVRLGRFPLRRRCGIGLGFRLALDQHRAQARALLTRLAPQLGMTFVDELRQADQHSEGGLAAQRQRVVVLKQTLAALASPEARRLTTLADYLVRKVFGSSVATVGPTTSVMADWTMCWRWARTSIFLCSTLRSIPTREDSSRRRRLWAQPRSSRPQARRPRRRIWDYWL